MEQSILGSTKKTLGLSKEYTAFDTELIMFINSSLSSLRQLGVGLSTPPLIVEDYEQKWSELALDDDGEALARIYVSLKVRLLFDPPTMSYLIENIEKQIREHEQRLLIDHDETAAETYAPTDEESEVTL